MSVDPHQAARSVLENNEVFSLATADQASRPWVVVVGFQFRNGKLHWCSDSQTKHSQNIEQNKQIGFLVFDTSSPQGKRWAVYGQAEVVGTQPDPKGLIYSAEVKEIWFLDSRKTTDGYLPRVKIDPAEL